MLRMTNYKSICIALFCLFVFISSMSAGTTAIYYVDGDTGDDLNPGTLAKPWKTISNGDSKKILKPGDTVMIAPGSYSESVDCGFSIKNCSGSSSAPITYKAQDGVLIERTEETNEFSNGIMVDLLVHHVVLDGFKIRNFQCGVLLHGKDETDSSHDITVSGCTIRDVVVTRPDDDRCAGIYCAYGKDHVLHRNIIYAVRFGDQSQWRAGCIAMEGETCTGVKVYNNTLAFAPSGIYNRRDSGDHLVVNNIFANMWYRGISGARYNLSHTNNLYFNTNFLSDDYQGPGEGEFYADPGFMDGEYNASGPDFHIKPDSLAVNTGVYLGFKFSGAAPDMGACETDSKYVPAFVKGEVVVGPSLYRSEGRVLGAMVESHSDSCWTLTDSKGRYSLPVSAGQKTLIASYPAANLLIANVDAKEGESVFKDFELTRKGVGNLAAFAMVLILLVFVFFVYCLHIDKRSG